MMIKCRELANTRVNFIFSNFIAFMQLTLLLAGELQTLYYVVLCVSIFAVSM